MNKKNVLALAIGISLFTLGACQDEKEKFHIEGSILNAEQQTLYLEEVGTGDILSLDSATLGKDGTFDFKYEGTSYPMFYRLRLGNQSIPFTADSVTHLILKADAQALSPNYELIESDQYNYQIRDIVRYRYTQDKKIDSLMLSYQEGKLSVSEAQEQIRQEVKTLKENFCKRYIYVEPKSPVSYFALFQTKDKAPYFSAEQDNDYRVFAAVATAYQVYYPQAPYTHFLEKIAKQAIARHRLLSKREEELTKVLKEKVKTVSFPEINLPDQRGEIQSLSQTAKRGDVLISFTTYSARWSPMLVNTLRKLKEKKPKLQIYEVSMDRDAYLWENAVRNLPWITVRDPEAKVFTSYNVQELPTFYLIKGEKLSRVNDLNNLF